MKQKDQVQPSDCLMDNCLIDRQIVYHYKN